MPLALVALLVSISEQVPGKSYFKFLCCGLQGPQTFLLWRYVKSHGYAMYVEVRVILHYDLNAILCPLFLLLYNWLSLLCPNQVVLPLQFRLLQGACFLKFRSTSQFERIPICISSSSSQNLLSDFFAISSLRCPFSFQSPERTPVYVNYFYSG